MCFPWQLTEPTLLIIPNPLATLSNWVTAKQFSFNIFNCSRIGFYFKTRGANDLDWSKYVQPFHVFTWLCVFAMTSIIGLIYNCAAFFDTDKFSILPIMYSQLCQGFPDEPSSLSRRTIFLCSYVFGYLIWNYYASALTAILAISKTTVPFTNLDTLLHQSNYIVLTQEATFYEVFFKVQGLILNQ